MPRERKTQSGKPALAIASTPGVRYGEGQNLQQLQQRMPSPDNSAPLPTAPPGVPGAEATPTIPPALAAYAPSVRPIPQPGMLLAPTNRPDEPVTAGMMQGPGPGPSQLDPSAIENPTGRLLRQLSAITGRQGFADLARRSNL